VGMKEIFMKSSMLFLVTLVLVSPLCAQDKDVPDYAKQEIARRGYLVQKVDNEIAEEDVIADAVALPADDSGKFSLTIVYGDNRSPMLDKLKADLLSNSGKLANWVNVKDLARWTYDVESTASSHLHVTFTQAKSGFKSDWSHIKDFPTFVIQAPRSGQFGKPGTVINQHGGYSSADELATWIEASIKKYVRSVDLRAGHEQRKAPFDVLPKSLPIGADPVNPFPPDLVPTTPKSLSLEEIKAAIAPEVPGDAFLLAQLGAKPTSADQVRMAWLMEKLKNPAPKENPLSQFPIITAIISFLIGSGVGAALLAMASKAFSAHAKTTPGKADDIMADLIAKLAEML
jgi:hypothetical protein